jgi:hypothetical protein
MQAPSSSAARTAISGGTTSRRPSAMVMALGLTPLPVALAPAILMTTVMAVALAPRPAAAQAAGAFTIADGSFSLAAPQGWKQVPPKSRIVEAEFQIPGAAEADAGRMTVMGAGGSIEANVDRWYGQFAQPDGSATKDHATTKKLKIAGCDVTVVDVSGIYKDMPGGPFAGGQTVQRPGYRMLAAIVQTAEGNYFLKFYGPAATVAAHSDGFMKMLEGMVAAAR